MFGSALLESLPMDSALFFSMIAAVFVLVVSKMKKKDKNGRAVLAAFLGVGYCFLCYAVLFRPYVWDGSSMGMTADSFFQLEWFKTIGIYLENQNYLPLCAGVVVTMPLFPLFRLIFGGKISWKKSVFLCLVLVWLIEPVQWGIDVATAFCNKVVDVDDWFLQNIGFFLGVIVTSIWCKLGPRGKIQSQQQVLTEEKGWEEIRVVQEKEEKIA